MDDRNDVRSWLGYDRIDLFGLSYGSRAVLAYIRQHPDRVRSATIMGVAPTYLKMPLYHSQVAARAMELLFEECERDSACHQAFPKIRMDFTSLRILEIQFIVFMAEPALGNEAYSAAASKGQWTWSSVPDKWSLHLVRNAENSCSARYRPRRQVSEESRLRYRVDS